MLYSHYKDLSGFSSFSDGTKHLLFPLYKL